MADLKQIPENWNCIPFGEIFEFLPTLTLSRSDLDSDESVSGVYNIHYGDIHSTYNYTILDFAIEKKVPKIVDMILDEAKLTFLKDGDLVIADASEDYEGVGTCIELHNIGNRKVTAGLHTFAAREKSNQLANGFKGYLFKHPWVRNELKKLATGSKVYGVSKSNIAELELVFPPLHEQQKIASILSKWDETIEAQTQLIEAKEKYKKGIMQKLLTGEVRFPGFEGEIAFEKLEKYVDQVTGFAFQSENFNQDNKGIRLCRGINITRGKLRFDGTNEMFWNDESIDLKRYLLDQGDIVISMDGSLVGRNFAIVQEDDLPLLLVQRVARLRAKKGLSQGFLYQWIASDHFIKYVDSVKTSSGIPHISSKQINDFKIPVMSIQEQQKIASILLAMDEEILSLKTELEAIKLQKKGLMQELLTGKIRVKS